MKTLMELADAYAAADATEHHSCLYGMPDEFQEAIADKQKARTALEQRIKELEQDAKRLDCWEATNSVFRVANTWYYKAGWNHPAQRYNNLREALDRAMSEAALTKMTEL